MTKELRLDLPCVKCGASFNRLAILAMIADLGARTSADPSRCAEGDDHDFMREPTEAPVSQEVAQP